MTKPLEQLIDCAGLMRELGIKRTAAEKIMRQCKVVTIPGLRKAYVKRSDVERLLEEAAA